MSSVYHRIESVHDEYTVYGSVTRMVASTLTVPVYPYIYSCVRARMYGISLLTKLKFFLAREVAICPTGIRERNKHQ